MKIGKKIIIVLNKCDLRSREENNLIKENIITITSARKNKISFVQTIAVSKQSTYVKSDVLNLVPDVGSLFKEIIETLDNNGEELLADNILFRSNKLGIKFLLLIPNLFERKEYYPPITLHHYYRGFQLFL